MSNEHIARAIVYAARQAICINDFGMAWEAIETNTANILAGCSVPADGKMNSAEALQATIMERLRTQADTPPNRNMIGSHPLPWTLRTVTIPSWRGPHRQELPRAIRHELVDDNGRIVGNIRNEWVAQKMVDLVNGAKDEHAQGIISRQIASLQRIKGERDEARAELSLARASQDKLRQEALANKVERDDFAQKWATLKGECHAQNQRANQAEKDNAELEARNVELRQQLENLGNELARTVCDRDGFRKGAQYWYDEATKARQERHVQAQERNAAESKVVKLRTFLSEGSRYDVTFDSNLVRRILEETK